MNYTIHGKNIEYDNSECGVYKSELAGLFVNYVTMNVNEFVKYINKLTKDEAIEHINELKKLSSHQAKLGETPTNAGSMILAQEPAVKPINEVKQYIRNTEQLCDIILDTLK